MTNLGKIQQNETDGGLGLPFLVLAFMIVTEYSGLAYQYLPPLKNLLLPLGVLLFLYTFMKCKPSDLLKTMQAKLFLFFIFLTLLAFTHGYVKTYAIEAVKTQIGYFILLWNMFFLINTTKRFNVIAMLFVLLHCYLVIFNIDKYFDVTRSGHFNASPFNSDGNDHAWSLLVAFPLALYLFFMSKNKLWKILWLLSVLMLVFGILGTQSRGAMLSLAACVGYYLFFVSTRKAVSFIVIGLLVMGAVLVLPGHFMNRMGTISEYEEDSSAQGRISAWNAAYRMALDHPVLGVGAGSFNSAYGRVYRKPDDPVRWISTHSVYFRILGEYGFLGVIIFFAIIFQNWKNNLRSAALIDEAKDNYSIPLMLPHMVNMALIGYTVAGTFLGGVNYPHIFLLTGLALGTEKRILDEKRKLTEIEENNLDKPASVTNTSRLS
ncbi:MAG: O-antigen ligase family protein [Desulfobacteraceae bacterium]|nr:O-antigen ligase family protein [Desulfobacteraceae bacterium]